MIEKSISKKLLKNTLIVSLLFLSACASRQAREDEIPSMSMDDNIDSPPASQNQNENREAKKAGDAPVEKNERSERKSVAPPTGSNDYQALNEAIRNNDSNGIFRAATTVLSKNPMDVRALNAAGLYHFNKGHYAAALLMFDRALKVNPNASEVHNNLGLTLLAQKENKAAMEEFRKALAANNEDGIAAANLGSIYIINKSYTKAVVANEIAYRKNSKDPKIANNYAISLTGIGKYGEAKEVYKKAMSSNENNKDVMMNYAILLIDFLNENGEGLDLINKARFLGLSPEARNRMNVLENKAKSGVK